MLRNGTLHFPLGWAKKGMPLGGLK